jgi:membrane protein DedA with SNARE-associated domain/rhodanese-related sulfurtransferase
MSAPFALIARHGLFFVFANVALEQIGAPVPAIPTLVVAGALAAERQMNAPAVLAIAMLACFLADGAWYLAGRRYGMRILKLLCKVSLSADSCVRQTETQFERWGSLGLVMGKFIPGVSTLAPPLAGAMGVGWARFVFFSTVGSFLWAAASIGAGMIFSRQIVVIVDRLEDLGAVAIEIVAALLALYIAFKWWERRRFFRMLRVARIDVRDLRRLMDEGKAPVVVDVRSAPLRARDGRYIPGAIAIDLESVAQRRGDLPEEKEIVFYCACPNEASAAAAAKELMSLGYSRVRPLLGGLDEWVAAGYEVETRA